jgi:hypothetical protein
MLCLDKNYNLTRWWIDSKGQRSNWRKIYTIPDWHWCGKKRWSISDHPDGAVPGELFSQKAVDVLHGLLDLESGDLYTLSDSSGYSYAMYILWERISVVDLPEPDVICGRMTTPVKLKKGFPTPHIFKSYHESNTWVTEDFKLAVENAKLTGFKFDFIGET